MHFGYKGVPVSDYIMAIDQGTTSTRAIIFDRGGNIISTGQLEC